MKNSSSLGPHSVGTSTSVTISVHIFRVARVTLFKSKPRFSKTKFTIKTYTCSMLKIIAICLVTFLVIVYWLRNAKQVNEIVADPLTTRIYRLEKKLNETAVKHEFDNIVEHNNDMISLKSDSFEALKDEKSVKKFQEEKRRKEDYEFSNVLKDSQMTNLIKINLTMRTLLTNIDEFILNETKRIKKEQQYYILINFIDNHYIIIFGYILVTGIVMGCICSAVIKVPRNE